jgi:hypothetical protein
VRCASGFRFLGSPVAVVEVQVAAGGGKVEEHFVVDAGTGGETLRRTGGNSQSSNGLGDVVRDAIRGVTGVAATGDRDLLAVEAAAAEAASVLVLAAVRAGSAGGEKRRESCTGVVLALAIEAVGAATMSLVEVRVVARSSRMYDDKNSACGLRTKSTTNSLSGRRHMRLADCSSQSRDTILMFQNCAARMISGDVSLEVKALMCKQVA